MAKKNYVSKLREKMKEKAASAVTGGMNEFEWAPDFGSYKIRILPPKDENDLFYHTHCYHFIPEDPNNVRNGKGRYLWARKFYNINGKKVKCPICEAVAQWYSIGRKENDNQLIDIAGALKQKRNYFMNVILLDEKDPEKRYKVLVDRTNEGKLTRLICAQMGVPFFRDIEDNWVDKESMNIDEDKDYFDLIDLDEGHDFKIIKKKTGANPWDISFEDSFVIKKSSELSEEDRELLDNRVDLKTYINYEEDYDVVKQALDNFMEGISEEEEEEEKPKKSSKKKVVEEDENDDEEDFDDDDDDDDEKPKKSSKKKVVDDDDDDDDYDDDEPKKSKKTQKQIAKEKLKKIKSKKVDEDSEENEIDEDLLNELDDD